ncbi:MAG: argininosuccinate lyase [Clostridiales bacterium]|nr:MAG: argininosuccinate lyase [Clostridiales bacterium]
MKMWQGRFKKEEDERVNDFNSSISFDSRMYKQDITGSIAHARMLGKTGIIEETESEKIVEGLKGILNDIEIGNLEFDSKAEDIHMFVEQVLTQRIGDAGKRLHTSRSRNDQVALDLRMYLLENIKNVKSKLIYLMNTVIKKAKQNTDTVMSGYTHLQRAQPITLAHELLAYAQMFKRDIMRLDDCYERTDVMPLGSCALAGTTYPIDREFVKEQLGFAEITQNSIDGVSDRDFVLEFAFDLSLIMMHLSRFSEEIILWCSSEFGYMELDDAFATGSSIMPQKKNPDIAELVRGKTGRVYGSLTTLLTVMKGIPLAYNKDMQEDKEAIFDALDNTILCLEIFAEMLSTASFNKDKMRASAGFGFINATDCADYLVKKGLPFRSAYKIVGELVAVCIEKGYSFETLPLDEYKAVSDVFENDVYKAVDLDVCVNGRNVPGGPAKEAVEKQIANLEKFIKEASDE